MRKRLFSASIFGACIICVIFVKNQFSYCLMHDCNYGMEALIRDGSVDNLFVGSSTFRQGLDIDILEDLMLLGGLGIQWCLKSEKAYEHIKKLDEIIPVDYHEYNGKYNERDSRARITMKALIDSDKNKVEKVFSTLV